MAGIYSGLLQYGPDDPDQWGPDLAERWQASADGLEYTFHLRRGVQWHDGQPFTAADVKASLDRVTSPEFRSPRCGTMLLAVLWSVPLGIMSAVRQDTWSDYVLRLVSMSGLSIPAFFIGVLLLFFLVRFFQWMPPLEFTALFDNPTENLKQLIWPALAEAYYISAPITRLTRSLMLEVIREDYVRTARVKGLPERFMVYKHALRNVLIPLITFVSWSGGRLLGGVVIMELIFAVPGMGTGLIEAVHHRDYPTVQAIVFLMAMIFLTLNLIVDLLYGWLDPRIRYQA